MVVYSFLCVFSSLLLTANAAEESVAVDQAYSHTHDNNFDDDLLYNDIYLDDEGLEADVEETTLWTTVRQATTITPSQTHTELSTVYLPSNTPSAAVLNQQQPQRYANGPGSFDHKSGAAPIKAASGAQKSSAPDSIKPVGDSRMKVPDVAGPVPAGSNQQQQRASIFTATAGIPTSSVTLQQFYVTRPANAPHVAKARPPVTITTTVMGGAIFDSQAQRNFANPKARVAYYRDPIDIRAKEFKALPVRFDAKTNDDSDDPDASYDSDFSDTASSKVAAAPSSTAAASSSASSSASGSATTAASATSSADAAQPTDDSDSEEPTDDSGDDADATPTSSCGCQATPSDDAGDDDNSTPDDSGDDANNSEDGDSTPDDDEDDNSAPDDSSCCPAPVTVVHGSGCDFDHQLGDDTMEFILNTKDHVRDRIGCASGKAKQALSHLRPGHIHERIHQVVHDERPMISDQNQLLHDKKGRRSQHRQYASYNHARSEKQARKDRLIQHAACNGGCPPIDDECEPAPKLQKYRPQKAMKQYTCCGAPAVRDACAPPVRDVCAPPVHDVCAPPVKAACAPPVKAACAPPVKAACPAPQKAKKAACAPPVKDTCPAPQKAKKAACAPPVKAACPAPQKAKKAACAPPVKAACPPPVKAACAPPVRDVCAPPVRDVCAPVRDVCDAEPVVRAFGGGCDFDHQFGDDAMSFILNSKDHARDCFGGGKQRIKQALSHFHPGHIHERVSQLLHDRRPHISDENLALHDRKGHSPSRRDRACGCQA